ncbi:MAG: hypothetical protein OXG72_16030 [Acidobacteria bacterium]|nr:hypothetical protein [Acidobacteriota bacterium]
MRLHLDQLRILRRRDVSGAALDGREVFGRTVDPVLLDRAVQAGALRFNISNLVAVLVALPSERAALVPDGVALVGRGVDLDPRVLLEGDAVRAIVLLLPVPACFRQCLVFLFG